MSLVQKLREMENLDIEKTREDEQVEKVSVAAPEQQEAEGSKSKGDEVPNGDEATENAAVSSLRPLTRSRTGRASKPRARDDSWYEAPKKAPAARKKAKSPRKRTIDEVDRAESEEPVDPPPSAALEPTSVVPPLNSTQAVFIESTVDSLSAPPTFENRSRSRTNLPIPVPNLIKKSRGRRVPIIAGSGEEEATKRLHVCKVEGCGKCFHRGEHLKRHIRSIHTHEKPFPCTYPSCHKFFNRHDNLLQHVKVHRNGDGDDDMDDIDAEGSPAPEDSRPASPANDSSSFDSGTRIATLSLHQHSTAITYPTLGAPMAYRPTSSYATNMAVSSLRTELSSLRTELPDSPSKASYANGDAPQQDQGDDGGDDDGEGEHYSDPEPEDGKGEQQVEQQTNGPAMMQGQSYYRLRTPPPAPAITIPASYDATSLTRVPSVSPL
ncbi:hypothetical protein C8R43DRAFT_1013959 [Mycena crocata]|nr:hypothetical protein C8R43DRAFT_1013959 [Mycena crocata]